MSLFRNKLLQCLRPIHEKLRGQKINLLLQLKGTPAIRGTLLDVGGGTGVNQEFLRLYANFAEVVVLNLHPPRVKTLNGTLFRPIMGDGRALPFRSQSFDWVFSNAVIEHVGGWKDQVRFAKEIRRVSSKGYLVATPNKLFPLEPHALFPFYQFLPTSIQRRVAPYSFGYLSQYEEIHLLSAKQMQELFPEARVLSVGFPVCGISLVAFHSNSPAFSTGAKTEVG